MTESEFLALGRAGYNRIPLHLETLADLDTPLSIYLKLANRAGSYLLESVIGGERFGRYSIVGLPARERLEVSGRRVTLSRDGSAIVAEERDDPLEFVDSYLRSFRAAPPAPRRARQSHRSRSLPTPRPSRRPSRQRCDHLPPQSPRPRSAPQWECQSGRSCCFPTPNIGRFLVRASPLERDSLWD